MRIDDEEIELTEEKAKRILIGCGILTEDGEIVEAYRDIIVKKEAKKTMKEYTVEVVETKIVYVEAENDDEAIMLAKTEAVGVEPDTIEGKIVRSEDDEEEPVTVCGEHGCDGCILQYAFDIEACKRQAPRTEESDAANRG